MLRGIEPKGMNILNQFFEGRNNFSSFHLDSTHKIIAAWYELFCIHSFRYLLFDYLKAGGFLVD